MKPQLVNSTEFNKRRRGQVWTLSVRVHNVYLFLHLHHSFKLLLLLLLAWVNAGRVIPKLKIGLFPLQPNPSKQMTLMRNSSALICSSLRSVSFPHWVWANLWYSGRGIWFSVKTQPLFQQEHQEGQGNERGENAAEFLEWGHICRKTFVVDKCKTHQIQYFVV